LLYRLSLPISPQEANSDATIRNVGPAVDGRGTMEMQQIRYFLTVADKLNFTRAAEQCNVTQPSLTRAIKLLEGELGGPLIRRERANTHLTELGRIVRSHLEQVYDEAQKTKRAAKELTRPKKTTLKLGVMCTIAPDQIIELIGSMQAGHPGVELRLSDDCGSATQTRGTCRSNCSRGFSMSRSIASPGASPRSAPTRCRSSASGWWSPSIASTGWRTAPRSASRTSTASATSTA
jgi:hypothetical protein